MKPGGDGDSVNGRDTLPGLQRGKGPGLGHGLDGIASGTEDPIDAGLGSPDEQQEPIDAVQGDGQD